MTKESPTIEMVTAYARNRVIGQEGKIPWQGQLPADMKHFKELTAGNTVLMGRKTYESIGHPLSGRKNIVISRERELILDGVQVVNSLEEALATDTEGGTLFIAGGQKVYELFLPHSSTMHVTEVEAEFEGDTFFVDIDPDIWKLVKSQTNMPDDKNKFIYTFQIYERKAS